MSKTITLDIETKNLDISDLDFNNPVGWEGSGVCIYETTGYLQEDAHRFANPGDLDNRTYARLKLKGYEELKSDLEMWFNEGYLLITKNGYNFDLPIISKSIEDGGCGVGQILTQFEEEEKHLDLQKYLEDVTGGIRFSLQDLIHAVLGNNESKLMSADHAPKSWDMGDYLSVVEYCEADAEYTYKVWDVARRKGTLQCVGKLANGKEHNCLVKIKW